MLLRSPPDAELDDVGSDDARLPRDTVITIHLQARDDVSPSGAVRFCTAQRTAFTGSLRRRQRYRRPVASDPGEYAEGMARVMEQMQPAIAVVTAWMAQPDPALREAALRIGIEDERGPIEWIGRMFDLIMGLTHVAGMLAAQVATSEGRTADEVLQSLGRFAARSQEARDLAEHLREDPEDDGT